MAVPGAYRLQLSRKRSIGFYMRPKRESMEEYYALLVQIQSDTSEHLPTLRRLAGQCDTVAELGTWNGNSAIAMMMGEPKKLISVDINECIWRDRLEMMAGFFGIDLDIRIEDSRTVDLPDVDMLFVDSDHTYQQVHAELSAHIDKVGAYLVFHDVLSFPDICTAIREVAGRDFDLIEDYANNNGLWVMQRKGTI